METTKSQWAEHYSGLVQCKILAEHMAATDSPMPQRTGPSKVNAGQDGRRHAPSLSEMQVIPEASFLGLSPSSQVLFTIWVYGWSQELRFLQNCNNVLGTILVVLYMPPDLILTTILRTWIVAPKAHNWLSGRAGCACKFVSKPCISPSVIYCLNKKKTSK